MVDFFSPYIELRTIDEKDYKPLFKIWNDLDAIKYTYHPYIENEAESHHRVKGIIDYQKKIHSWFGPFSIIYNDTVIGLTGLEPKTKDNREFELWYILAKDHWGKGLGTQAVYLTLQKAFNETDAEMIYAEVVPENIAGWKLLEKVGMHMETRLRRKFYRDGEYRDLLVYTLNRKLQQMNPLPHLSMHAF